MAGISLDNIVMYPYPRPKKPSKLPVIPHGTSSFQSNVAPLLLHPLPLPQSTCAAQATPTRLEEQNSSSVALSPTHAECQPDGSHQWAEVAHVDCDVADEESDVENIKSGQSESQNTDKDTCDDFHDIDGMETLRSTAQMSTAKALMAVQSADVDISSHTSNIERHDSAVPQSPVRELLPNIAEQSTSLAERPATNPVIRVSASPVNTIHTLDPMCTDTPTITALEDHDDRQRELPSSTNEDIPTTGTESAPTQKADSSQSSGPMRSGQLQKPPQRQSTSAGTTSQPPPVAIRRRALRSSNISRTRPRSHRSPSVQSTEDDDSQDSDYQELSHADLRTDLEPQVCPAKRRRQANQGPNSSHSRPGRPRRRAHSTASSQSQPISESMVRSSARPETIRILGRFLCKIRLGRVEYCCCFTEEQGSIMLSPSLADIFALFQEKPNK